MFFSLYCILDLLPLKCFNRHFSSGDFLNVIFKGQDYFPNLFIFQTINTFRRSSPLNWVKIRDLVKQSALAILSWANCLTYLDSSFLISVKQASDFWYSFLFQPFPPWHLISCAHFLSWFKRCLINFGTPYKFPSKYGIRLGRLLSSYWCNF